jgi:hypothetical protein
VLAVRLDMAGSDLMGPLRQELEGEDEGVGTTGAPGAGGVFGGLSGCDDGDGLADFVSGGGVDLISLVFERGLGEDRAKRERFEGCFGDDDCGCETA